jgi:Flp pilus assembly protein TadG
MRSERGATAVEFAMVLPVLLILILGIVEFGRAFQLQASLAAAAREGVRIVALQDDSATAVTTVTSVSPEVAAGDITITPCAGAGSQARVDIDHQYEFMTGFFGTGIPLTARGVMRCHG